MLCCALAQESKTTVTPLEGEEILKPCEYRMVIPNAAHPVRAVWAIWDRGMDFVHWYEDADVRALAREFDLALVLAAHCRSKEREDMIVIPEKGVGRAFFIFRPVLRYRVTQLNGPKTAVDNHIGTTRSPEFP